MSIPARLLKQADLLSRALAPLHFGLPITHVYDPLSYAREPYANYLARYARTKKRVLFVGMNPGPYGMTQTGVPFGEISFVRDWLGISGVVERPAHQHPKRPVTGFDCARSEVSGTRLWGLWKALYGEPDGFFSWALVANYCPLVFMEESGRNVTPDKLPRTERDALFAPCDVHLRAVIDTLAPEWVVGIGQFAFRRAQQVLGGRAKLAVMPHPSPASPAANRDYAGLALAALAKQGLDVRAMTASATA